MGLRPGRCYATTKDRAYTRHAVRVQKRDYIGAVPGLRTRQWNMGNGEKEFDTVLDLVVSTGPLGLQLRDNAIESARLMINRKLLKMVGKEEYFLKLRVYPHHILRENKQAQGAGADRVSKGMSHSFGKAIGRAARIRNNQKIFSAIVMEENVEKATQALLSAAPRFPCEVRVTVGKDVASIGTKPKKTKEMLPEEEAAAEEAPKEEAAETKEKGAEKGAKAEKKEEPKAAEKKGDKKEEKKK